MITVCCKRHLSTIRSVSEEERKEERARQEKARERERSRDTTFPGKEGKGRE